MNSPIELHELDARKPAEREALTSFYDRCGYRGDVRDTDRILVATSGCTIVGAVRACEEAGHLVLRGMFVCPAQRGRGIGRQLLAAWIERFGRAEALALPVERLAPLYGKAGFTRVEADALPPHLALRLDAYRSRGHAAIAMRRAAA